jgi:hypothetical protein
VGVQIPGKCEVLSSKYQLYAQCLNEPDEGEVVCGQCLKANLAEKNGTVHDRLKVPLTQYIAPSGKKPTNYGNVMNTRSYTMEDVLEYAKSHIGDIQIPEEHFKKNRIGNGNAEATIATKMPTIITEDDNMFNEIMNDCDDIIDDLKQLTEADKIKEKEIFGSDSESEEENEEQEHEPVVEVKKTKAQEKAEKLAKKEQEKAEKLAKKEQEKAEKLAKKEQEKAEKLAKKEKEKAEKLAKKEQEKAEKLAKKEPKKVTKKTEKEKTEDPILGEVIGPLEPEIPSLINNSPIVSKKESEKNDEEDDVVEDGLTYITETGQSVTDDYAGPIYMLCSKTNKVYNTDTKDEIGTFDSTWDLILFYKNKIVPIKELVEIAEQNNSQTDFDDLGDDFDIDMDDDDEEDDDNNEGGF